MLSISTHEGNPMGRCPNDYDFPQAFRHYEAIASGSWQGIYTKSEHSMQLHPDG